MKKNKTIVYTAALPQNVEYDFSSVYPLRRREYILSCKNESLRKQKYCAWKLLSYILEKSFRLSLEDAAPILREDGKWISDKVQFSITNTDELVSVAVSYLPVGIDAQKYEPERFGERMAKKLLTEKEYFRYLRLNGIDAAKYLNSMWTKKESIFKITDEPYFVPHGIETDIYNVQTKKIVLKNSVYFLSVCTDATDVEFGYFGGVSEI